MSTIIVRIVRPSDGNLKKGQTIDLKDFLTMVEYVLKHGGEMPIAVLAMTTGSVMTVEELT